MAERGVFLDHSTLHRWSIKRVFARFLVAGIETMHMIRKGQLEHTKGRVSAAANQFYCLAL